MLKAVHMRISIIQDIIHWADVSVNLEKTGQQIKELAGQTDLVVLPEMFTTGFTTTRMDLAEDMNGITVQTLKQWAADYQLAITGSFIATENGQYYNRAFFVFPDGRIETADKRHLFSVGGEDKYFSAGDKRLLVNYLGFNICVLICYDLRFPVWARNVDNQYDLLIYTANWPARRIKVWDALLTARALENQTYVCGVNRVGDDGENLHYDGHSHLIDYKGNDMLNILPDKTQIKTVEIPLEPLQDFRKKFPVWKDADKFTMNP